MKLLTIVTKYISTFLVALFVMVISKDAGKAGVEWLFLAAPLVTRTANMIHDCGAFVPLLTETSIANLRCVFEFGWRDKVAPIGEK